jgi:hypothetical protein
MAVKRGKKSTKKVKNLVAKSLSADKAKRVRGGVNFGKLGSQQSLARRPTGKTID